MTEATRSRTRVVSAPPHIESGQTCTSIMLWVVAALAPSAIYAVWLLGGITGPAAVVFVTCIAGCLGVEAGWNAVARKPQTLADGSALVTGLLLAMSLPPRTPWWMCVAGAIVAIGLGKLLFGGLGFNLFNPALVGRAAVTISWAGVLAGLPERGWFATLSLPESAGLDAVSGATRLGLFAADRAAAGGYGIDWASHYRPLLFANTQGSVGEVSALLLAIGGLVLIARGIIDWRIPAGYIGSVAVLSWAFGADPIFHVLAGGVLLGAFFMATDYVTSPMSKSGRLVFGVGCGVFNVVARFFGAMPEATTFAILFMNGLSPLIDRAFTPRTFGWVKASD